MLTKINDLNQLKKGNIILTVDLDGNEELCKVNCIDNAVMWTEGCVDKQEISETFQELEEDYKVIYLLGGFSV